MRGFGTSPEPDALNPEINLCKRIPAKTTGSDKSTKSIKKNKKDHGSTGSTPKRSTDPKKGPIPLTTYGTCGSLLVSLCFGKSFQCSHVPPLASPHAFLVLMQLQWSRHAGPGGLKVGHLGKGVDLRGILPTCLWPKFHTCMFASTVMSAVEVLRTIAF